MSDAAAPAEAAASNNSSSSNGEPAAAAIPPSPPAPVSDAAVEGLAVGMATTHVAPSPEDEKAAHVRELFTSSGSPKGVCNRLEEAEPLEGCGMMADYLRRVGKRCACVEDRSLKRKAPVEQARFPKL